jgi:hypothetical protein
MPGNLAHWARKMPISVPDGLGVANALTGAESASDTAVQSFRQDPADPLALDSECIRADGRLGLIASGLASRDRIGNTDRPGANSEPGR